MTDFQDCLKRRIAYVAIGEFKSGKFGDVQHLYEEAVATYSDGFEGAYLFQKPETDQGVSVVLWESAEDMDANQSEDHRKILAKMQPLFTQPPETAVYELVCKIDPPALAQ